MPDGAGVLRLPLSVLASLSDFLPLGLLVMDVVLLGELACDVRPLLFPLGERLPLGVLRFPLLIHVSVTVPEPVPVEEFLCAAPLRVAEALALVLGTAEVGDEVGAPALEVAGAAIEVAMAPAFSENEESVSLLRPNVAVESEGISSLVFLLFAKLCYYDTTADNLS